MNALKKAFNEDKVYVTSFPSNTPPFKKAPSILQDQDVCIVFANSDGGEGYISSGGIRGDRNDLHLQKGGEALVSQVAEGCGGGKGSTIVVVHSIGPVTVEKWIDLPGVKAVLMANLPGQESGNAIVDVLFGDANPSGRLPYTIGRSLEDYGPSGQILFYPNNVVPQQNFSEGLYIDYRHFDKYNIEPRFEFGFGMSYTTFEYLNLTATSIKAKSAFPSSRPQALDPPSYDEKIPDPSSAVFPENFRKLKKFIYPYIESVKDVKTGAYPYPDGYTEVQKPSPAGGGEGGNPSLWDIHVNVTVQIKNTGTVAGKEVVQLYLQYPDSPSKDGVVNNGAEGSVDFPVKVLRGFEKIFLEPGETKLVQMQLTRRDLSFWDVVVQNWKMPTHGKFKIWVGASSRDLRLVAQY